MKKGYTDITFLLDRSASMMGTEEETIQGFNAFLKEQKEVEGEATFSLVQFATTSQKDYTKNIKEVENLNRKTYSPTGSSTAYLDALGKAINETGERLRAMREEDRPERVIFVVITDGLENASREFSKATISQMVKHQEDAYKWQFVFLGANLDAVAEGQSLGINVANAMTYRQDSEGIRMSYSAVSRNLSNYRKGVAESMAFTEEDRKEQEEDSYTVTK